MEKIYDARVALVLEDKFARMVNNSGLHYTNAPEIDELKSLLVPYRATLTNAMRDFEYYVQASDAHDAAPSPIIDWSRDATQNDRAIAYYATKFVVTTGAGQKIFPARIAHEITTALKTIEGKGVLKEVQINSMNPSANPPIPEKYFQRGQASSIGLKRSLG